MKGTYWEHRQKQGRFDFAQDVYFDEYFQINWLIGDFFESLAAKIIGHKTVLYDKMRAHERGSKAPDLINWNHDLAFEVKGSSWGRSFKISSRQLENYREMTTQDFPLAQPEIYYVFFAYSVFGKWKDYETEMNLIKTLAKSVRFAVIMPLSLVEVFSHTHPWVVWKRQYDYLGTKEHTLVNVKMHDIWDFQIRTAEKMAWAKEQAKEWEMKLEDYQWENSWSRQFRLCQFGVSRFPITTIIPKGARYAGLCSKGL